jgi:hypothetical protein
VELAVIAGRSAHEVSKSDWEQAKQEFTGGSDTHPKAVDTTAATATRAARGSLLLAESNFLRHERLRQQFCSRGTG